MEQLIANPLGGFMQGLAAAKSLGATGREGGGVNLVPANPFRNALAAHGQAALSGDKNALNALFAADPEKGLRFMAMVEERGRAADDRAYTRGRAAAADRRAEESHGLNVQALKLQIEERTRGMDATERAAAIAAERSQLEGVMKGASWFVARGDEAGYNEFLAAKGVDPAEMPFAQFPAHAAEYDAVVDVMRGFEEAQAGPEPEYKVVGNTLYHINHPDGPQPVGQGQGTTRTVYGPDGTPVYSEGPGQAGGSVSGAGKIPEETLRIDDPNSPYGVRSAPIPGSEADRERVAAERKSELASARYEDNFALVDGKISEALTMLDEGGRWVAGMGSLLSGVPETKSKDFDAVIQTLQANLGFDELQAMRDSSPTGGALGQVTERELAFLQSVQANLDTAQSPAQLKTILQDLQARRRGFREERNAILGQSEPSQGYPATPEGMEESYFRKLYDGMPDEDKALFQ